jgi:hypothetical protein
LANALSHAALPYPIKHARYTLQIPFLDSTGEPTDPTAPDTEISTNGGASFADCVEEVTVGGGRGGGYITLTGAEMNNDAIQVWAGGTGIKSSLLQFSPRDLPVLSTGTARGGGAGGITLAAAAPSYDIVGCIVRTTGGTGGGGTGGANNQARLIMTYDKISKIATVSPNWETNPSADTTYEILETDQSTNRIRLGTICDKLPNKPYLTGTDNPDGNVSLFSGTVSTVTSQTEFNCGVTGLGDAAGYLAGCTIVIHDSNVILPGELFAIRTIVSQTGDGGNMTLIIDEDPGFAIVEDTTTFDILPPAFNKVDRAALALIYSKIPPRAKLTGTDDAGGYLELNNTTGGLPENSIDEDALSDAAAEKIAGKMRGRFLVTAFSADGDPNSLLPARGLYFAAEDPAQLKINVGDIAVINRIEPGDPTAYDSAKRIITRKADATVDFDPGDNPWIELDSDLPARLLSGTVYVEVYPARGLEQSAAQMMQTVIDNAELGVTDDTLTYMRKFFFGGKIHKDSSVDATQFRLRRRQASAVRAEDLPDVDDLVQRHVRRAACLQLAPCRAKPNISRRLRRRRPSLPVRYTIPLACVAPVHGDEFVLIGRISRR